MSIRNYVNQSLGSRRTVRIITVDPTTRKIEGQLKDGGLIQISLFDVPPFFVWPRPEEYWIVRQDGGYWKLYNKFDNNDDQKVRNLNPGEAKVAAEVIKTPSGKSLLTAGDNDYDWINLKLINGWQDVSTLDSDDAGVTFLNNNNNVDKEYLLDLPPVSYQYNHLTKAIYLRGALYTSDFTNAEFSMLNLDMYKTSPNGWGGLEGEMYKPKKSILGLANLIVFKTNGALAFANSNQSGAVGSVLNDLSIQIDDVLDSRSD